MPKYGVITLYLGVGYPIFGVSSYIFWRLRSLRVHWLRLVKRGPGAVQQQKTGCGPPESGGSLQEQQRLM